MITSNIRIYFIFFFFSSSLELHTCIVSAHLDEAEEMDMDGMFVVMQLLS